MKSANVRRGLAALLSLGLATLQGQTVPAKPPAPMADEVTTLSPFEVNASTDIGYSARETLAGSRLKTELKDTPSQISVMTKEFLEDIASVSVEDAYRYSVNVENTNEFFSAATASGDFNVGVINLRSSNRIRGLTNPGVTHDFFQTTLQQDTFNTERVSFSSGPNSILFGNGNPAGIIDTSYLRANVRRPAYSVSLRNDNYRSWRVAEDFNQPLIKDTLALRIAGLNTGTKAWREPGNNDTRRFYAAVALQPTRSTTIRAYYESASIDQIIPRNTRIGDQVTPWIAAGRPIFDNGLTSPGPSPDANDPVFARNTGTSNVLVMGATAANPFLAWGSSGTSNAATVARYSVTTKGPGDAPYQTGTDSYLYSLANNNSISPVDVSVNGTGTRNWMQAKVNGFSIEQRVGQNLFLEFAFNQEENFNPVTDFLRGITSAIKVDANRYLPDRVTPNPNVGRYYVEGGGRVTEFFNNRKESRVMASYDLDLTRRSKWFGRHRLAAMYQRSDKVDNQQDFVVRAIPAGTSDQVALDNYGGPMFNTTNFRAYLSDPQNSATGTQYTMNLPFDPFKPFTLPNGATVYTINNPFGGTTQSNLTHAILEGRLVALQDYWLKDRLVTTFGWRHDNNRQATTVLPRKTAAANSAFATFREVGVPTDYSVFTKGETVTAGGVLHVLPWFSLFYNQSDTWNPPRSALNPDGSSIPGSIGDGQDYGIMVRLWQDRVSLRLNKYKNTSGPDVSTFRTQIIPVVQNIEETLSDAADAGTIVRPPATGYNPLVGTFVYDMVSNQVSTGYEFELVANPSRSWRVSFNGAKANATQSDIGKEWIDFIHQRLPIWTQYATLTGPNNTNTTIASRVTSIVQTLELMRQSDGQKTEAGREWRINLVSRYTFLNEGRLKGVFIGGGYRWRSESVVGYRATTVPNSFTYPGAPAQLTVPSVNSPILGRPTTEVEGFFGYAHKLGKHVTWRGQLNVRNLLDSQKPIAQRANTAGAITIYTVPEPRSFILTNTFSF